MILTKENIKVGLKIECIGEDWGEFRISKKYDEGIWEIDRVGGSDRRCLFEQDFRFWEIVR